MIVIIYCVLLGMLSMTILPLGEFTPLLSIDYPLSQHKGYIGLMANVEVPHVRGMCMG